MISRKIILGLAIVASVMFLGRFISPPTAIAKVELEAIWNEAPLENLITIIEPLYAPQIIPNDLTLTHIFLQVPLSSIKSSSKPEPLDSSDWHIELNYGKDSTKLWIYIGTSLNADQEVQKLLKKYTQTEQNVTVTIDQQNQYTVPLQQSADKNSFLISFNTGKVDMVVVWYDKSLKEMQSTLTSLTTLHPDHPFTQELQQQLVER
jgi:hypothetical protein